MGWKQLADQNRKYDPQYQVGTVGTATLASGSVTVNNVAVKSTSNILISRKTAGGTVGDLRLGTVTPGVSFVITSATTADTSVVTYHVVD